MVFHSCRGCALTVCFRGRHFYQVALGFGQIFVGCFHILDGIFFPPKLGRMSPMFGVASLFASLEDAEGGNAINDCSWGDFTPSYGLNLPISGPFDPGFLASISHPKQFFFWVRKKRKTPKKYIRQQLLLWLQLLCQKKTNAFWASSPFLPGFFPGIVSLGAFRGGGWGESAGNLQFWATKQHEGDDSLQLSSRPFTAGWEIPKKKVPWDSGVGIILWLCPRLYEHLC